MALFIAGIQIVQGQGRIVEPLAVPSQNLGMQRTVRLYLPASYDKQSTKRYPVLYVHDGQNVFSTAGTNIAFGWGSWELDKTVDRLSQEGTLQEIIMVAVDNSPERYADYCGRVSSKTGPAVMNEVSGGKETAFEKYANFLIHELKPKIDREYRTLSGPENTGVMGSSLGGICSVALGWEHPEVFGKAASLSGAFQVDHTNFLKNVLRKYQGKPKPVRIYLDSGTIDFTGGDDGRALTAEVVAELKRMGWENQLMHYVDTKPLTTTQLEKSGLRRDKWPEAGCSQHNEFYWKLRSERPLRFLFPKAD